MRILGIDFGTWSIKAVEVETNWRKSEILDLYEVPLPLQMQDTHLCYQEALKELLQGLPSHPDKIITSLPADKVALRFLRIPISSRKKVEQMFRFELEDSVPLKLEEAILDHKVSPDGKGSLVVAALAPHRLLSQQIDWFQSVGVDPDWICFDGMGAINSLLGSNTKKKGDSPTHHRALLDIGHSKSHLTVFEGTNACVFRTFPWGSSQITEIIANNWGQALEDAQELKHSKLDLSQADFGGVGEDTTEAILQSLKVLISDIIHTLAGYRNTTKNEVQLLELTGGGARLKGISSFLEDASSIKTCILDPTGHLNFRGDIKQKVTGSFSEALGRSQVFTRKVPFLFNFRKGPFSKNTSLSDVGTLFKNVHFKKTIGFGAVLALILLLHSFAAKTLAKRQAQISEELLSKTFQDSFRTVPQKVREHLVQNPEELRKFVQQRVDELNQRLSLLNEPETTMGALLKKVSSSFSPDIKVDVHKLQINQDGLFINGVIYQGDLNQVTRLLNESGFFSDLTHKTESGKFEIAGKVLRRPG